MNHQVSTRAPNTSPASQCRLALYGFTACTRLFRDCLFSRQRVMLDFYLFPLFSHKQYITAALAHNAFGGPPELLLCEHPSFCLCHHLGISPYSGYGAGRGCHD